MNNPDAENPGAGDEYTLIGNSKLDRLERAAVKRRWNIPEDKRDAIIDRQVDIATDQETSPREATAAARALIAMESQNLQDEHKAVDVSMSRHDLESIAQELGLDDPQLLIEAAKGI